MYKIHILDKDHKLKATLPGVRWKCAGGLNVARKVEVQIPRTTIDKFIPAGHSLHEFFNTQGKIAYAEIAAYLQIKKGTETILTSKITKRQVGEGAVSITSFTEESLLEANQTPAQYGEVWEGWDLADLARDILDGWHALRVKDQSQWQDRIVDSSNVDLTTEPGVVMLSKRSNGRYYDSGYITLKFDKSEVLNFKGWDRVRWSADSGGEDGAVQTTIQTSTDGTSFGTPFDGGEPEKVGYVVTGDSDSVWVRINLITRDTEGENPDGDPTGVTPVVYACELIARTHKLTLDINAPEVAGVTVSGVNADNAPVLAVVGQACASVGWEFAVKNGTLNLAEKLGVNRTKDFVFRASTNTKIETLSDGDSDLVNILTAYGSGSGINRLQTVLYDYDSIESYGEYPKTKEFDAENLAELEQKAQEYLDEHKEPQVDFRISVNFPYGKEPSFGLGDTVKVADADTGVVTETRIVHESREYSGQGLTTRLQLGKPRFSLTEIIGRDGKDGQDGEDGRDGRPGKDGKDADELPTPADPAWGTYRLTDKLYLTWHKAEFASGYEIRDNLSWGSANGQVFRGYAHEFGFTPLDREMILYIRAFNAVGEYSENYATLNVSLPAPQAPNQPFVREFFKALRIDVEPLNEPSVRGYHAYVTAGGTTEKVQMFAGSPLTYSLESGVTATIQISAYDVIGEGAKSEPLQATTKFIDEDDLPDEVVKARHMVAGAIDTLLLNAELATIDEADALKLRADKITVGGSVHSGIPITKPKGGKLWHFDTSLHSTDGIKPLEGAVATLRPNEGKFGGAVAVEEGTTNIVVNGDFENGTSNWGTSSGDTISIDVGYRGNGLRCFNNSTSTIVPRQAHTLSLSTGDVLCGQAKIKGLSGEFTGSMRFANMFTFSKQSELTVDLGDGWKQYYFRYEATSDIEIENRVLGFFEMPQDYEFIVDEIQLEKKPFATSFVDGTRPDGILAYPITLKDDYTIACYRKSHTDEDYKHVVKRSDGKVFVDGVEDSEYDVEWIAGRNLIPDSNSFNKFSPYRGAVRTITENIVVPEWGATDATRLTFVRGTDGMVTTPSIRAGAYSITVTYSFWAKNNGDTDLTFRFNGLSPNPTIVLKPGESKRVVVSGRMRDNYDWFQHQIRNVEEGDIVDVTLWRAKLELGSESTHWTPAPEDLGYDGDTLMLSNQTGLVDELLVLDYEATDEEIKAWYNMGQPFYDPYAIVDDSQIPSAGKWSEKNQTFYSSTPPTATAIGDMWYDTSDDNKPYRWDGADWVDVADVSPIDANKRPVTATGAGGYIEVDKHGLRMYRVHDIDPETGEVDPAIELDINEGSAYYTGNVISANPTTGDYSELTDGRLSFYKNTPEGMRRSYYTKRIQTGVATNGQHVELVDFEYEPVVMVTPIDYFAGSESQQMETKVENLTREGFTLINRLVVPLGGSEIGVDSRSGSRYGDSYSVTSEFSSREVVRIDVNFQCELYAQFKKPGYIMRDVRYNFYYQAQGSSTWIHAGNRDVNLFVQRDTGGLITSWRAYYDTVGVNFSLNLAKGVYRARVDVEETYYDVWRTPRNVETDFGSPSIEGVDFDFEEGGEARFIAIEGG